MGTIREPKRNNSIEKKKRIIEKGFELMCENGFYNTNAIDIAKYAGVSTGIIYQYFTDKKDIFINGIKDYYLSITDPIIDNLCNIKINKDNLEEVLSKILAEFINNHKISFKAHKELDAMKFLDDDIEDIFLKQELNITDKIVDVLINNGFNITNIKEKVHLVYGIMDNFAHEVVYHKHEGYDYNEMKKEVIKAIINILN